MSNYRVRQVLALGAMPDRQFRFLVALASWMTDDTRTVRVGFDTLMENVGQARNTVRTARRELEAAGKLSSQAGRGKGNLTVWTVLCLPETAAKGVSEVDPFSEANRKGVNEVDPFTEAKGVNRQQQKGSIEAPKRGQPQAADQEQPDMGFNRRAKPSLSRARAAILAAVPTATDTEIELLVKEIDAQYAPGDLGSYVAGFPAEQIAERICRMRGPGRAGPDRPAADDLKAAWPVERPRAWPQWCGDRCCSPATSQRENLATGAPEGPCPACHPSVVPASGRF